jgi:glucoamylase
MEAEMADQEHAAPGAPGNAPTWTSSAKDSVATALGASRLWATYGYGIVNEVYWPSTGEPQIRDLGFIVATDDDWWEVKRVARYELSAPHAYVPLTRVVHEHEAYRLELEFRPHPDRDVLLVRYRLDCENGRLYVLLAPHLNGDRQDNDARAGHDLVAEKGGLALCLMGDGGFARTSAGYVGASDGWQDFSQNGAMTWTYDHARNGNVALTGELNASSGVLALGFARSLEGARTLARSSLAEDYGGIRRTFVDAWESWGKTLDIPYTSPELRHEAELSAAVLKVHEDRTYAGALVASLSVPWGSSHDDLGGYHLVWTRDAVEAALALVVVGQVPDALRMLAYLIGTQAEDGSWAQNYFPDGTHYWTGRQLDEVALPIVLVAKLKSIGALMPALRIEAMVRKAIGFIVRNGPTTGQDRWEENGGINTFTLAVTIAALVAGSELLDADERAYVLSLADCWNERIENWTYVENGPLCADSDAKGYYIRIAPPRSDGDTVMVRNCEHGEVKADALVGLDFLYLVRTGLRRADDPRIIETLKVVEKLLRVETPSGPGYHRYNGDGYGENADGTPFDGTGIGRLWPLLTGERGHYAVAAGEDARPYLETMMHMAGTGGMLPEQVWDSEAIPKYNLYPGRPSGSAMPLVWAHAEFLKLLAASATGRAAELLDAVETRYDGKPPAAATWHWRMGSSFSRLPAGRNLAIEATEPFVLHCGFDGWDEAKDVQSEETCLGMHAVRFSADELKAGKALDFTLYYPDRDAWLGQDMKIEIGGRG